MSIDHSSHIITIDGPAGAGKSTIAHLLAERLGWLHLDTGAMYRAVAAAALLRRTSPENVAEISAMVDEISIDVTAAPGQPAQIVLDSEDVTDTIRTPEVSRASSPVSAVPAVRHRLVALQREIAARTNTVAEGRDMGTVVFPNAQVKVYLTASPEVRAERRVRDFAQQRNSVSFEDVLAEILDRDRRDSSRAMSPLRPADDALIIETDNLSPDEIVDRIIACYVEATS